MVEINFSIKTLERIHIGSSSSGLGISLTDLTLKDKGLPIIPGSALKGALRFNYSRLLKHFRKVSQNSQIPAAKEIFGAENRSSKILVKRAEITDKAIIDGNENITSIRTRIAIEKNRRTTKKHSLFNLEEIIPNLVFESTIIVDTNDIQVIELILLCLKELELSGIGHNGGLVKVVKISSDQEDVNQLIEKIFSPEVD